MATDPYAAFSSPVSQVDPYATFSSPARKENPSAASISPTRDFANQASIGLSRGALNLGAALGRMANRNVLGPLGYPVAAWEKESPISSASLNQAATAAIPGFAIAQFSPVAATKYPLTFTGCVQRKFSGSGRLAR